MTGLDDWIAQSSDGKTLLVVVVVAAALGLRHATYPDHLAAVTTLIATGDPRSGRTARDSASSGASATRRPCSLSGCRSSSTPPTCPSPSSRAPRPRSE
jgi:hypothetical protein